MISIKSLNPVERKMITDRRNAAFEFIRTQNATKKELRNPRAIEKAKKVRDTLSRWIDNDDLTLIGKTAPTCGGTANA